MDIEVYRPKQYCDMLRDYKLLADGKEIAAIKRGTRQRVSLPRNTKTLQARFSNYSSCVFDIKKLSSNKIIVKNAIADDTFKRLFFPLYYMLFRSQQYLLICEDIGERMP